MNKYLLAVLCAILLLAGLPARAQDRAALSRAIKQQVARQTIFPYADARVRQMCIEWPTCKEWAINRRAQDSSFQIVDAEMEHWVSGWNEERPVWKHRFYVQTEENGQLKAYLFKRQENGVSYASPVLIKNFPGHPVPSKPSEHTRFVKYLKRRSDYSLLQTWPVSTKGKGWINSSRIITSQYITKWDEQGNAIWQRRLYVEKETLFSKTQAFRLDAYQTQAGGDYSYSEPVEIAKYPSIAQECFVVYL